RQGLTVHRQVGCGGFRIDLAIIDPAQRGCYRLGVECDGAAYHCSTTARDRDRLRQEVLEGLGWRICRVWSTDWVRDRATQVRRALEALAGTTVPFLGPAPIDPPLPPPETTSRPAHQHHPAEPPPHSIDDVPDAEIQKLLLDTVARFGGTGTEDL